MRLSTASRTVRLPRPEAQRLPFSWASVAIVISFTTLPMLRYFIAPFETQDEAILVVFAEQVTQGRVPNRDFFTVYGPANYWLLAAVFQVTGPSVVVERAVGLVYHLGISTGIFAATRTWGTVPACVAAVAAAMLLQPLELIAYAWLGGVALVLWAVALLLQDKRASFAVLAGLMATLAIAWRYEMVVVGLLACTPLIWRDSRAKLFLLGAALGGVPTAAHLLMARRSVYDNVVVGRLAVDAQLDWSANLPAVIAGLTMCAASVAFVGLQAARERTRLTISLTGLCVSLLPQSFQRIDLVHVLFTVAVSGPVALAQQLGRFHTGPGTLRNPRRRLVTVTAATVPAVLLLAMSYGSISEIAEGPKWEVTHRGRSIPVASRQERDLVQATISSVARHIPAGSVLFVGAKDMSVPTLNDVRLYYLLPEYRASAYFLDLPAGVAEQENSGLRADIVSADALALVNMSARAASRLFPNMKDGTRQAQTAVTKHFCVVDRTVHSTVYVRCRK